MCTPAVGVCGTRATRLAAIDHPRPLALAARGAPRREPYPIRAPSSRVVESHRGTSQTGQPSRVRVRVSAAAPVQRVTLTPIEAAAALGVSRDFFDEHVKPELRLIRRGRLVLVPVGELERWANASAERTLP